MSAGGEQAWLRIGARPKAESHEEASVAVEEFCFLGFCPIEPDGLVSESPGFDYLECFLQQWIRRPQQQHAVIRSPVGDWQRPDVGERHAVIIGFRTSPLALAG